MVIYCCVPFCYNNAKLPGETFHCFPKCAKLKNIWMSQIRRDENKSRKVTSSMRVCSRHFLDSDYKTEVDGVVLIRKRLFRDAVPSIFPLASPSKMKSQRRKLRLSNDITSEQVNAMDGGSEIVPKVEIKLEPLDNYSPEATNLSDTFDFLEIPSFERCSVKVEREDLPTLPIKIKANATALKSLKCPLCSSEFPSENSLREHFLSAGEFYTCRKILEMNQPVVILVRVDAQHKTERRDDNIEIKEEKLDSDDASPWESWDKIQVDDSEAVARRDQIPVQCSSKSALRSHVQQCAGPRNRFVRAEEATAEKSNAVKPRYKKNICPICAGKFPHTLAFNRHLTKKHPKSVELECNFCSKPFILTKSCLAHCNKCPFASLQNTCYLCSNQFARHSQLRKHFLIEHPHQLPSKCNNCAYECKSILAISKHARSCSLLRLDKRRPQKLCPVCLLEYSCNADRYYHVLRSHLRSMSLYCNICSQKFMDKVAFTTHLWKCLAEIDKSESVISVQDFNKESTSTVKFRVRKKLKCAICRQSFVSKFSLVRHIKKMHCTQNPMVNSRSCFICSKNPNNTESERSRYVFACKIVAKKHILSQLQESSNDNLCPVCLKTHTSHEDLTLHLRKCLSTGPGFFCYTCTMKVPTLDATKRDVMLSHPKFLRSCEKCLTTLTASVSLVNHLSKVHSSYSAFFCFVCVTVYYDERDLLEHLKVH